MPTNVGLATVIQTYSQKLVLKDWRILNRELGFIIQRNSVIYAFLINYKKMNMMLYLIAVTSHISFPKVKNQKLPNGYWNDFAHIQEEALKWKNAREFAINGKGAYNAAKRNGWLDKIKYRNEKL